MIENINNFQKITASLIKKRCQKHLLKPVVLLKNESIELICCCDSFKEKLKKMIEKDMSLRNFENVNTYLQIQNQFR